MNCLWLLFSYLLGSIPFGLLIGKIVAKKDVRQQGSGNIGATNVTRMMGKKYGALVLLLDGLKSAVPIILYKMLNNNSEVVLSMIAFIAIIGHCFPVWLNFKGGKGVSSALFAIIALDYRLAIVAILVWLIVYVFFKIVSAASLFAMLMTTIASCFFGHFILMCFLTILIFYTHRENIKKIINGEELKFRK
ncbi:MAG: glycerol-3-phosphate 1-O-acyltransferase PlsY [Rickettsiales bacterium]|jgi:glycerol-3-phosphate acyltransferase PlsY|nr:glycerol-3-phosphate 1-O-acyltransferase PlsY [Rickettsiales bacterium]